MTRLAPAAKSWGFAPKATNPRQPTGLSRPTALPKLGHAKASITMDFYAHAVPENDQKAAQIIGELPQRKPKQAKIIPMPKSA